MKRIMLQLCAVLGLPLLTSGQEGKPYLVSGFLSDYQNSNKPVKVYLFQYTVEGKMDSVMLKNGKFSFSGKIPSLTQAVITVVHPDDDKSNDNVDQRYIYLPFHDYLTSGKITIKAKDSIKHAVISGSPLNVILDEYAATQKAFKERSDSVFWLRRASKDSLYKENVLTPALRYLDSQMDSVNEVFIRKYPGSEFSLELFKSVVGYGKSKKWRNDLTNAEFERIEIIYKTLRPELRSTKAGMDALAQIEALKAMKVAGEGDPVVHFAQAGIDGEVVDTRKLQGKIYLIDFWGSWCVWCRVAHPHLKELYAKYKDKGFEIIAVAREYGTQEEQEVKWRQAVKEDGIPWQHVLNNESKKDLVNAFGISAYPTKLLIGRDGTILLRVTGDPEQKLDKKLEELFNPSNN